MKRRMVSLFGLIKGYGDGSFKPDGAITGAGSAGYVSGLHDDTMRTIYRRRSSSRLNTIRGVSELLNQA